MGSLGTRAAVILDLDGDGDLDIVTNEFNAPPQVFLSDLAQRRRVNFLEVRLRGTRSNREGLGAHRSEEHTSELQSRLHLVCRLLLEKKKKKYQMRRAAHTNL